MQIKISRKTLGGQGGMEGRWWGYSCSCWHSHRKVAIVSIVECLTVTDLAQDTIHYYKTRCNLKKHLYIILLQIEPAEFKPAKLASEFTKQVLKMPISSLYIVIS